jgi:putative NIF3 family GTP cyclohydrolase 1 type 2
VITHEPTFWEHAAPEGQWRDKDPGKAKVAFLKEAGLTVLRAHDTWDQWPEHGIRDAWAAYLGFGKPVYESKDSRYYAVYDIPEQDLRSFAQHMADKVRPLGEDSAQVIGDPARKVRRAAIGVGCITPDEEYIKEGGADVIICCYDGASYWSTRERLHESGAAVITLEHGSTEIPGMESLTGHLAARYPGVEFIHIGEHARTWTVRGK